MTDSPRNQPPVTSDDRDISALSCQGELLHETINRIIHRGTHRPLHAFQIAAEAGSKRLRNAIMIMRERLIFY